jgi:hypothetical protein
MSKGEDNMKDKKQKPIAIRLLNTVSAFMLIGGAVYIFFAGITLIPSLIFLAAIGALSGPVIILGGSEGTLECLIGILEAFVEGILGVFETIGDIFGSILG